MLAERFSEERLLEAVALDLGVSRERVRQLEKRELGKLRRAISEGYPEIAFAPPPTSGTQARSRTDGEVSRHLRYPHRGRKVAVGGEVP